MAGLKRLAVCGIFLCQQLITVLIQILNSVNGTVERIWISWYDTAYGLFLSSDKFMREDLRKYSCSIKK